MRQLVRTAPVWLVLTLALGCSSSGAASVSPAAQSADLMPSPASRPPRGIPTSQVTTPSPSSASAVAITPDGNLVVAVNPDSATVSIVDSASLLVRAEVAVGLDPRTVAITPDSAYALVSNHGDGTVSAVDLKTPGEAARWDVGPMPYGIVTDGRHAWVTEFALGRITVIDLATGVATERIDVEPFPAGAALSADGRTLAVTHFYAGRVSFVDTSSRAVTAVASTGLDTNLSQFAAFSSDGSRLYLPQTRSNASNPALLFDTTVFPIVNVVTASEFAVLPSERITIDTADRPVDMPFSAAVTPDGGTLVVLHAGSDNLSVFDLPAGRARANIAVGANPRGLALSPDGTRVFVDNVLDGTLSVVNLPTNTVTATVRLTNIRLAENVLAGKRIFNSAREPDLATDNWISCAVCHFDGMHDARTWLGFPDGPRNTPSLLGLAKTGPFHWSGDLDELQDVELTIRKIQAGQGLVHGETYDTLGPPHAGMSADLDNLAAYLATLRPLDSPVQADRESLDRGQATFTRLGCAVCHASPLFTDRSSHDVGTGNAALERNSHGRGTSFDTPSLRGLWMSAPYLHDGSALDLPDVLKSGSTHNVGGHLTEAELRDLIAYLVSL